MNMSINNVTIEFRTPISLLNLLIEKDQTVIDDLKTIFETLDNGDAMDIDGISDDEMRELLGVYIYLLKQFIYHRLFSKVCIYSM